METTDRMGCWVSKAPAVPSTPSAADVEAVKTNTTTLLAAAKALEGQLEACRGANTAAATHLQADLDACQVTCRVGYDPFRLTRLMLRTTTRLANRAAAAGGPTSSPPLVLVQPQEFAPPKRAVIHDAARRVVTLSSAAPGLYFAPAAMDEQRGDFFLVAYTKASASAPDDTAVRVGMLYVRDDGTLDIRIGDMQTGPAEYRWMVSVHTQFDIAADPENMIQMTMVLWSAGVMEQGMPARYVTARAGGLCAVTRPAEDAPPVQWVPL